MQAKGKGCEASELNALIRFAVVTDDSDMVQIISHQTRTALDLPACDVPLLIEALQNLYEDDGVLGETMKMSEEDSLGLEDALIGYGR